MGGESEGGERLLTQLVDPLTAHNNISSSTKTIEPLVQRKGNKNSQRIGGERNFSVSFFSHDEETMEEKGDLVDGRTVASAIV